MRFTCKSEKVWLLRKQANTRVSTIGQSSWPLADFFMTEVPVCYDSYRVPNVPARVNLHQFESTFGEFVCDVENLQFNFNTFSVDSESLRRRLHLDDDRGSVRHLLPDRVRDGHDFRDRLA